MNKTSNRGSGTRGTERRPVKTDGKGAGGASGLAPRAIEADRNLGTGGDTVTAPMTVDDLAGLRNYADPKEDRRVYPSQWDHGFLVYPKGSARIGMRRAGHVSPDQWREAVRLLRAGHVIAFNANENEGPDIACDLAQRCKDFRIGAVCPGDDELIVYFLRVDEANSE